MIHPFARARAAALGAMLGLLAPALTAQLQYDGAPCADDLLAGVEVPTVAFAAPDRDALIAEDRLRPKGEFRFGIPRDVAVGLTTGGVWQTLPNGDRVWRLRITSEGAYSLSPQFSEFTLTDGARLFVYNDDRSTVRGAYTARNNKPNGQFAIQPTAGDAITLEYVEPAAARGTSRLTVAEIIHDYRDFVGHGVGGLDGGACNVDVNCPAGAPWRNQINAVVGVVFGGFVCTASLINNSANDGRQLLISANHCGSYSNAVFLFNFQRSGCSSGSASQSQSVQGSRLLATGNPGDYRLVEILETIPPSFNAFYNGWNRGAVAATNTLCVHHPSGCPKKISFDNDPPVRSGQYWRITDWDVGTTEPGSSGSPLMDQSGRFIGQLCCGLAACGNNLYDEYGALNTYWSNVAQYLDPLNTGATTISGFDPNQSCGFNVQATSFARNGAGVNPAIFSQTAAAIVGQTWLTSVNLAAFPGAHTVLLVSGAPDAGTTIGGPFIGELLCQNPVVAGGVTGGKHSIPIPFDCSLAGATFCSQAIVLPGVSFVFTNALDVTVGTF